ncbi:MAG: Hpt domain-containing protein [Pseudomonadota bacterium]
MRPEAKAPEAAAGDRGVSIHNVPYTIRNKVVEMAGTADAKLVHVERMVEKLSGNYETWVKADVERMRAILDGQWADPSAREQGARALYLVAHDIKGQAGTFGFQLVTSIAALLCKYLNTVPAERQRGPELGAHIDAISKILGLGIKGDGGPIGTQILASLSRFCRQ